MTRSTPRSAPTSSGRPLTPAAQKYADLAAQGYSQSTTASILGVSREAVRRMANKYGIEFEDGHYDYELECGVRNLHAEGLRDAEIARRLGRWPRSIAFTRERLGLPSNKAPTWEPRIRECAEAGMTLTETGRLLGLSTQNVWFMARRWGITFHAKYRARA